MTTRSVHLEIVLSMGTSCCVMGIERFIARRGMPSVIWSDNGANLVDSAKEMISCTENWNRHAPVMVAHKGLAWNFNPTSAPHHWRLAKRADRRFGRQAKEQTGGREACSRVLIVVFRQSGAVFFSKPEVLDFFPVSPTSNLKL